MAPTTALPAHMIASYDAMLGLVKVSGELSEQMRRLKSHYDITNGSVRDSVDAYRSMQVVSYKLFNDWTKGKSVNTELIRQYGEHAQKVRELDKQYESLIRIQKALDLSTKTVAEKFAMAGNAISKLTLGGVQMAAKLTTLAVSYDVLKDKLINYNRAVFDGMRIGERYGDSFSKFNSALEQVRKTTAFSRQDFADLNLAMKQMMVGLPMTSDQVAKLAGTLSGKLGWSADQAKKAIIDMMPLQNKLPSIFDRIKDAQNAYNRSTTDGANASKALYNQLRAIGATGSEIENVLNFITNPSVNLQQWVNFEKSISKSKQSIEDANLVIAEKMEPGLRAVAETQAKLAEQIAKLPSGLMLSVGAFAFIGVEAAKVLSTVINISKSIGGMRAMTAAATGGMSIRGVAGAGLATAAVAYGGDKLGDWATSRYLDRYDPESGAPDEQHNRRGAARVHAATNAMTGAGIGATWGYKLGGGRGAAIGSAIGFVAGGAIGGVEGWMQGGDATEKQKKQHAAHMQSKDENKSMQEVRAARLQLIADAAGISVKEKASTEESLQAIKNETDLHKQKNALASAYRQGLVTDQQMTKAISKNYSDGAEAQQKVAEIITETLSGLKDMDNLSRSIERAVQGQRKELDTASDVYKQIADAGREVADLLGSGMISKDFAKSIMESGVSAQESIAKITAKKAALSYIEAFSSNPEVMSRVFGNTDIASEKLAAQVEPVKKAAMELNAARNNMFKELDVAKPEDKSGIEKKYASVIQAAQEKLEKTKETFLGDKSIDVSNKFGLNEVKAAIAATNEEMSRLKAQAVNGVLSDADLKKLEGLRDTQTMLINGAKEWAAVISGPITQAYENVVKNFQTDVGLQEQLIGLGESRLALAEKMGLAQSYRALKDQIGLVYERYQLESKTYKQLEATTAKTNAQLGLHVDINSVINNTKTVEQARAEAIATAGGDTAKIAQINTFVNESLKKQIGSMTNMVQLEGKLAELTKTWREGWMSAMEEEVINAGDFAAVIGIGDKNIPEKIAVGAPDTFRYGGTNRAALDDYTMQQLRYGRAPRFTNQLGQIDGNIQQPSPLMNYSNATAWNPQTQEALHSAIADAVQKGITTVNMGGSPVAVSQMGNIAEATLNASTTTVNGTGIVLNINGQSLKLGEHLRASNKSNQPGNPDTGLPRGQQAPAFASGGRVGSKAPVLSYLTGSPGHVDPRAMANAARARDVYSRTHLMLKEASASPERQGQAHDVLAGIHDVKKAKARSPKGKIGPKGYGLLGAGISIGSSLIGKAIVDSSDSDIAFHSGHAISTVGQTAGLSIGLAGLQGTSAAAAVSVPGLGQMAATGIAGYYIGHEIGNWVDPDMKKRSRMVKGYENRLVKEAQTKGTSQERALLQRRLDEINQEARMYPDRYGRTGLQRKSTTPFSNLAEAETAKRASLNRMRIEESGKAGRSQIVEMHKRQESVSRESSNIAKMGKSVGMTESESFKRFSASEEQLDHLQRMSKMKGGLSKSQEEQLGRFPKSAVQLTELMDKQKAALADQKMEASQRVILQHEYNMTLAKRTAAIMEGDKKSGLVQRERAPDGRVVAVSPARPGVLDVYKQEMDAKKQEKAEASANLAKQEMEKNPNALGRFKTDAGEFYASYNNMGVKTAVQTAMPPTKEEPIKNPTPEQINQRAARVLDQEAHEKYVKEHPNAVGRSPTGQRIVRAANGGAIEPGSFIVKQSAASANADMLNSIGAGWVTGGVPGKDSVMFDVMATGGTPSNTRALLMPGEAVVPPEFASIGEAINSGVQAFGDGGMPERAAARDISSSSHAAGMGSSRSPSGDGGTMRFELSPEVAELLRFQGKGDYQNGSAP